MKEEQKVSIGLYRKFNGEYYYVTNVVIDSMDNRNLNIIYFNVCHPEYGSYSIPLENFISDHDILGNVINNYIKDRMDNVTGQTYCFERVKDLNFQIGSISTEQLIRELQERSDSPIHELDIEGLESEIFNKDYIAGYVFEDGEHGSFLDGRTIASFEDETRGKKYVETHISSSGKRPKLFKRILIEVK